MKLVVSEADGAITVSLERVDGSVDRASPHTFRSPLEATDLNSLGWYLETYLDSPHGAYETRARGIEAQFDTWGVALFDAIFGVNQEATDLYRAAGTGGLVELLLRSEDAAFLRLPWELMRDPLLAQPLSAVVAAFCRTPSSAPHPRHAVRVDDILRVLLAISRPKDLAEVDYRSIARPLLRAMTRARNSGKHVRVDVLRPPTLDALITQLRNAREEKRAYHILHFDGHGSVGDDTEITIWFETSAGHKHAVSAGTLASTVIDADVPIVVLNACQSAQLGERSVLNSSLATRLVRDGVPAVLAMSHSLLVSSAVEFMTAFYEDLFTSHQLGQALKAGRQRLAGEGGQPRSRQRQLADWMVPVLYVGGNVAISSPTARPRTAPSIDPENVDGAMMTESDAALATFVGRVEEFHELERAFLAPA